MNLTELSDCELLVMKCLWDVGSPMPVSELIERIKKVYGKEYKETTVYTFLKRLRDKGYVSSYKKGASYFMPLVSETDYLNNYAAKMSQFLGRAASDVFLAAFSRDQKYTDDEWKELLK